MKVTVKQLVESRPFLTEGTIRWLLFNRATNGLSPAVFRLGRRILVEEEIFDQWVNSHAEEKIP